MKTKFRKAAAAAVALVCMLTMPLGRARALSQGTRGDELQVLQAEQLEVRLGPEWAGRDFTLRTDAGLYPGSVRTDPDGTLRMEVGGSSRYVLTLLESGKTEAEPEKTPETGTAASADPAPGNTAEKRKDTAPEEADGKEDNTRPDEQPHETILLEEQDGLTASSIPRIHLALFGGGMILAVGSLIWISCYKKKHRTSDPDRDEIL